MTELTKGTFSVNTKEDLTKESTWIINGVNILGSEGAQVFCLSDSKVYILDNDDFTQEDNWVEVKPESGGSNLHTWDGLGTYKYLHFKKSPQTISDPEIVELWKKASADVTTLKDSGGTLLCTPDHSTVLFPYAVFRDSDSAATSFSVVFAISSDSDAEPLSTLVVSTIDDNSFEYSLNLSADSLDYIVTSISNPDGLSLLVSDENSINMNKFIASLIEVDDEDIVE